jgi:hypothetical protein
VPNNRRRWLFPNAQTVEVAETFFSEAIRAADLIVVDQVVISIGAAFERVGSLVDVRNPERLDGGRTWT